MAVVCAILLHQPDDIVNVLGRFVRALPFSQSSTVFIGAQLEESSLRCLDVTLQEGGGTQVTDGCRGQQNDLVLHETQQLIDDDAIFVVVYCGPLGRVRHVGFLPGRF